MTVAATVVRPLAPGDAPALHAAAGTDVHKFDPDTRYLDLIIQANISGAAGDALVVTSIELIRMPHVNAASYIGTAPTTSATTGVSGLAAFHSAMYFSCAGSMRSPQ